jgi:hypothetical protein
MEMSAQAWAARAASLPRSGRVSSVGPPPGSESSAPGPGPAADDTFQVFNLSTLNPAAGGLGSSSINEPSVAQAGKYVFYTWNWGAARSKNGAHGGLTWTYINPYADMPDFCCDQDVIYDKGRDIILWYRQAVVSVDGGSQNRFFLGVSGNGGASFCTYDFRPSGLGFTNRWFDYPRLALSNNYVYINTNLFVTGGGFDQHILMRWPLTALSNCAGFGFSWWGFAAGWSPAQVENAREIMYLGDQIATVPNVTTFRVYWQPEDTGTLSWVDRAITPFLFTDRFTAHCPVAGGADPCQRADMRITGGVLARNTPSPLSTGAAAAGQIDFYWNVKEGGSFPKPYTESAGFDEATLTYNARKLVWNSGTTWFYTAAAANDRGHVALSTMEFLPGANPRHEVSLDDDYNGSPPGWSLVVVRRARARGPRAAQATTCAPGCMLRKASNGSLRGTLGMLPRRSTGRTTSCSSGPETTAAARGLTRSRLSRPRSVVGAFGLRIAPGTRGVPGVVLCGDRGYLRVTVNVTLLLVPPRVITATA